MNKFKPSWLNLCHHLGGVGFEPLDLDLPCGVGGCCRSVRAAAAAAASPRPPRPAPAAACPPISATVGEQVANLVFDHVQSLTWMSGTCTGKFISGT